MRGLVMIAVTVAVGAGIASVISRNVRYIPDLSYGQAAALLGIQSVAALGLDALVSSR